MSEFTKNLREQSEEMREAVKEMKDRLDASSSSLREQLLRLSTADKVPDGVKAALIQLADEHGGSKERTQMMTVITGAVTANIFDVLADLTDYLTVKGSMKTAVDKLKKHREFNEAIRMAGASGDWSKFDELVDGQFQGQEETGESPETSGEPVSAGSSNGSSGGTSD